jgi:hypothetical protein
MKTIRITLSKTGAQAVCRLKYHFTTNPEFARWTGDRKAFRLANGNLPSFLFPIDSLESVVAHQAVQSGANYQVEDLGGEAITWTDNVIGGDA